MGRELRRKQEKKDKKNNKEKEILNEEIKISKLLIILGIVIVAILVIYLVAGIFITKEIDWFDKKENTESTEKVDNAILAKSIFKSSEEEYYVYFYDFNEKISDIESAITGKLYDYTIYRVNTNDALNKNYVSTETNTAAKNLEELKVKNPTLIKITNGEITGYYETEDDILSYLG